MKQKIEKALTVLLMIYAGSAVAEGKVNDLCHIGNRVDKLEIINYPQGYTSPVSIDEGRLNEIYKYKVEITELDDKEREVYKNRTRNILIFELLIYMLLFVSYKQYWSGIIIMSITVVSALVYIGYLQNNIINKR